MNKVLLYGLIFFAFAVKAQVKDNYLPLGNENFTNKNYVDAEANYRLSQAKFKKKAIATYNLGTSIYKQKQPLESKHYFEKVIKESKNKTEKHQAYHNLGNILMEQKEYSQAVDAYKNALRNNPADEETRYNYALAKKMLKDNPPPPPPKNNPPPPPKDNKNNKNQNKDQNKDNKDQNKNKNDNKDKGDNKDQNKGQNKDQNKDQKEGNNQDNQDKGNGDQPQQPSGASKQRIKNLLDAVNNEEKKVQEKVNAQKVQANPKKPEKDW